MEALFAFLNNALISRPNSQEAIEFFLDFLTTFIIHKPWRDHKPSQNSTVNTPDLSTLPTISKGSSHVLWMRINSLIQQSWVWTMVTSEWKVSIRRSYRTSQKVPFVGRCTGLIESHCLAHLEWVKQTF